VKGFFTVTGRTMDAAVPLVRVIGLSSRRMVSWYPVYSEEILSLVYISYIVSHYRMDIS
jgi:hypothetical protein